MKRTPNIEAAIAFYGEKRTTGAIGEDGKWTQDVVLTNRETATQAALDYLAQYEGDFLFLRDVKAGVAAHGISLKQTVGVLNCMMAEVRRETREAADAAIVAAREAAQASGAMAPKPVAQAVPDGTYTVVMNGTGDYVTLRVDTPGTESKWADIAREGKRIARYLAGPDNEHDYKGFAFVGPQGQVMVWKKFRVEPGQPEMQAVQALRILTNDPKAVQEAGVTYAMRSGNCCKCGRKLTVPASLHMGMGPICAEKAGLVV